LETPDDDLFEYWRKDADEVRRLQSQLHIRGVQAWRDATHLLIGSVTKDEIICTLTDEYAVFLLYAAPFLIAEIFLSRYMPFCL